MGCSKPEQESLSISSLTRVQDAYISRHGSPDLFAVTFDTNKAPARRIDTWVYFGATNRMVVFDDGFLVEEEDMKDNIKADLKTGLKPTEFSPSLAKRDITNRFGNPDNQELTAIAGSDLTILRYEAKADEPMKTFGFVNNELVAVTIGFLFAGK